MKELHQVSDERATSGKWLKNYNR